jgi:hypothetical protein
MIEILLRRPLSACGSSLLPAVATMVAIASAPVQAAPLPYAAAVSNTQVAARAVLARAGRETCLRGKITRALLGLSSSCEASGSRTPLCALAEEAVVVTPMSLSFMDDTSRRLLELIQEGGRAADAAAAAGPSSSALIRP